MKPGTIYIVAAVSWAGLLSGGYWAAGTSTKAAREWKAPRGAADTKNPIAPNAKSLAAGRSVYSRECASCHGNEGKGDGKDGRDLEPAPANLLAPNVTAQTDGALFWKISTGRKPMPSFRKDLSDEEALAGGPLCAPPVRQGQ